MNDKRNLLIAGDFNDPSGSMDSPELELQPLTPLVTKGSTDVDAGIQAVIAAMAERGMSKRKPVMIMITDGVMPLDCAQLEATMRRLTAANISPGFYDPEANVICIEDRPVSSVMISDHHIPNFGVRRDGDGKLVFGTNEDPLWGDLFRSGSMSGRKQ